MLKSSTFAICMILVASIMIIVGVCMDDTDTARVAGLSRVQYWTLAAFTVSLSRWILNWAIFKKNGVAANAARIA
jgi:hypothetical protein